MSLGCHIFKKVSISRSNFSVTSSKKHHLKAMNHISMRFSSNKFKKIHLLQRNDILCYDSNDIAIILIKL